MKYRHYELTREAVHNILRYRDRYMRSHMGPVLVEIFEARLNPNCVRLLEQYFDRVMLVSSEADVVSAGRYFNADGPLLCFMCVKNSKERDECVESARDACVPVFMFREDFLISPIPQLNWTRL